jgi:soluble lytic murein transglycosylase-like protein
MMPSALLALAAAIGALYWYIQRQQSAGAVDQGNPLESGSADDVLGDIEVAALGAGQALLYNFGTAMKTAFVLPAGAAPYLDQINAASAAEGLPEGLLARLLYEESRFRPDIISGATTSTAGAEGIAQFMPATSAGLGIDPLNPAEAIPAAAHDLRKMFDLFGTWSLALAAYNWGQGNVTRKGIAAAPAETRKYVSSILGDLPATT